MSKPLLLIFFVFVRPTVSRKFHLTFISYFRDLDLLEKFVLLFLRLFRVLGSLFIEQELSSSTLFKPGILVINVPVSLTTSIYLSWHGLLGYWDRQINYINKVLNKTVVFHWLLGIVI